ncbi:septum formation family protein [Micromonospora sp. NBC_01813]|uniref:septum formation family protein n=1 Tax=Micromonospora sp. NBC_01813 TaxID=2975988 RepID=UPI002DDB95C8|nr:septum formation family protein [Micromonospora sp. NBC_01813]WSA10903.1 septum formation family protein [Micromonospora sp. NBC_01813]
MAGQRSVRSGSGRRAALATALTLAVAAVAGCAKLPEGVDGELVDGWAAFAEPVAFVPAVGTCHNRETTEGAMADYIPVDCAQMHLVEIVHVGAFAGEHAEGDTAPEAGSAARIAARTECDQRVAEFIGGPWQAGTLRLVVVTPSQQAWDGGARWLRCDLGETSGANGSNIVTRSVTLKGVLTDDDSSVPLRCFDSADVADDDEPLIERVDCGSPHQSEYAGTYLEDKLSYREVELNSSDVHGRCKTVVASYAKVPDDDDLQYRVGTIYSYPTKSDWADGDRTIRCFAWRADPLLTRSVRGGGNSALPIQYE